MSPRTQVAALFEDTAENMLRFFEGSDTQVRHQGEKGGIRQERVRAFLEKHLPSRYGVTSGHIIDRQGGTSLQEDIVLFDQLDCPAVRVDERNQVLPCETVYGAIEVKSLLSPGKVRECMEHTHRLRQLDRGELGPLECFVFAYDSYDARRLPPPVWARDKFQEVASSGAEQKPMPSLVLSLRKRFILHLGMDQAKYIVDELESGILLYFLDLLLIRLSRVRTSSPRPFFEYGWERTNPIRRYK